jgi:hypothetical protein
VAANTAKTAQASGSLISQGSVSSSVAGATATAAGKESATFAVAGQSSPTTAKLIAATVVSMITAVVNAVAAPFRAVLQGIAPQPGSNIEGETTFIDGYVAETLFDLEVGETLFLEGYSADTEFAPMEFETLFLDPNSVVETMFE